MGGAEAGQGRSHQDARACKRLRSGPRRPCCDAGGRQQRLQRCQACWSAGDGLQRVHGWTRPRQSRAGCAGGCERHRAGGPDALGRQESRQVEGWRRRRRRPSFRAVVQRSSMGFARAWGGSLPWLEYRRWAALRTPVPPAFLPIRSATSIASE